MTHVTWVMKTHLHEFELIKMLITKERKNEYCFMQMQNRIWLRNNECRTQSLNMQNFRINHMRWQEEEFFVLKLVQLLHVLFSFCPNDFFFCLISPFNQHTISKKKKKMCWSSIHWIHFRIGKIRFAALCDATCWTRAFIVHTSTAYSDCGAVWRSTHLVLIRVAFMNSSDSVQLVCM